MGNHLDGLPKHGVTLSGSPENPVIENRSGKTVIAYVLKIADRNGRGPIDQELLATSVQPAGIPDGGSLDARGAMPVNPTVPMQSRARTILLGQGPIVSAALLNVIFADGRFVGADDYGAFDQFVKKIKAITEVGILAKTRAWDQVEALAQAVSQIPRPPIPSREDHVVYFFRQVVALRLAQTRKFEGDAAAAQLAELYSSLPTLWK